MPSNEEIRVLHVTRAPLTVSAFLMPILREHRARRHWVAVACNDGPPTERIEAEGFPVFRFKLESGLGLWNFARAVWELVQIVRDQRIDWVFAHMPMAGAPARLAARLAGARGSIYMAHGFMCWPYGSRLVWHFWYVLERLFCALSDGLITINNYDYQLARRNRMIRRLDRIFRVNGVGVDCSHLEEACRRVDPVAVKRELTIPPSDRMVLFLGRTIWNKGVREFLGAARTLVQAGLPAAFVIAGSGPLDDEIAEFIRRHNLAGRVHHLGWRGDAPRLLAACDLFVLPSSTPEGLPVSILEAMACSKPVIATRHRGCEDEVLEGVTGLLVEPQNEAALARAIRAVIEDPDMARRLGEAGHKRVNESFRVEMCTQAIMAAFEEIVRHPGGVSILTRAVEQKARLRSDLTVANRHR